MEISSGPSRATGTACLSFFRLNEMTEDERTPGRRHCVTELDPVWISFTPSDHVLQRAAETVLPLAA